MFGQELKGLTPTHINNSLENIQYQLYGSYMRHASQKLTPNQLNIMMTSELLIQKMSVQGYQKQQTDLSTTQASLFNSRFDDKSSCRSKDTRTAFKRKSRCVVQKKTKGNIFEIMQEIKEVCSQKTIFNAQFIFGEYQRMLDQYSASEFRQGNLKRRKEKCETCVTKESQSEIRSQQYEQKIIALSVEVQKYKKRCDENDTKMGLFRMKEQEHAERQKTIFDNCREYLIQKESAMSSKCMQLKLVQRDISNAINRVCQTSGCERCEIVRSVKGQLLQYRRFYEREYQKLQKLFQRYKKVFK